ncbi:PKD domain-containing protein [Candidatus Pacearchaeota archaeon]|nr:PKD domain-containing protein [Candidatus Pacearchaeota archaeon]
MIVDLDSGLGASYTYLWEFGDGQTSTSETPTHEYLYSGTYDIRLTVTNEYGSWSFTQPINVPDEFNIDLPVAAFTVDVQSGANPLTVTCTDTSTGDIAAYKWYVDDVLEGTIQAFNHQFTIDGEHTIKLVIEGAGVSEYSMVIRAGSVPAKPLISGMDATVKTSIQGKIETTFSATVSDSPSGYLWDFGAGAVSELEGPSFIFDKPGTYPVSLTATNQYGFTTSMMTIRVIDAGSFTESENDKYIGNVKIGFYVVDAPSDQVLIYKSQTEFIKSFGSIGTGEGQFNNPTDVAIAGAVELIDRVEL